MWVMCLVFKIGLNLDTDVPIYRQIMMEIERAIARGELGAGLRLPSQREMAVLSGTNPNTVQRAYRELESEGVIETRRGQGTYVREDPEGAVRIRRRLAADAVSAFIAEMKALGMDARAIRQMVGDRLEDGECEEERSLDREGSDNE